MLNAWQSDVALPDFVAQDASTILEMQLQEFVRKKNVHTNQKVSIIVQATQLNRKPVDYKIE